MNYYLSRDGQSYGPYPEESFPEMLQAGQFMPEDLVCPEGGSEWVALSQVVALAATPVAAPATGGLSLKASVPVEHSSGSGGAHIPSYRPAVMAVQPQTAGQKFLRYLKGKVAVVAVALIIILCFALWGSARDKYISVKLGSEPGWKAFNAGNSQIKSETTEAGYGNNAEATTMSKALALTLHTAENVYFVVDKTSVLRSRGVGLVSAADAVAAGSGRFETYIDLRPDRALVLIHVPEYQRYKGEVRAAMRLMCWAMAYGNIATTEKKNKDYTLVVGIRGKDDYDCVYVSKITGLEDLKNPPPAAASGNFSSQECLVKWFAEGKP
jgi:hypothetical protein